MLTGSTLLGSSTKAEVVLGDWISEPARMLAAPARWIAAGLGLAVELLGSDRGAAPLERKDQQAQKRSRYRGAAVAFARPPAPLTSLVPRRPRTVVFSQVSPTLPAARTTDYVAALARQPETAFVFWALSADTVARARHAQRDSPEPMAVRIRPRRPGYETTTESAGATRVITLRPGASSLYVTGLRPGMDLEISVGFPSSERFVETTEPTFVRMPHRDLATVVGSTWRDHASGLSVPGYDGVAGTTAVSPRDLGRNLPPRPATSAPVSVSTPAPNPRAVPARQ